MNEPKLWEKSPRERVQRIPERSAGRWLITTMGSTHLVDLDKHTIARSIERLGHSGAWSAEEPAADEQTGGTR